MSLVAAVDRIRAAQLFLHNAVCVDKSFPCIQCRSARVVAAALDHLDEYPRDARGVRRIFHDAVCLSGCTPDSDHADRTQATTAAALRRFRKTA